MFPERLKRLRLKKKVSQQEMADLLGITRQGYAKYENNHSEPSFDVLQKISSFFDVTTDFLIGRSDDPDRTEDEEFEAFAKDPDLERWYRKLPESSEEDLRKLRQMWEIIRSDNNRRD